MKIYYISFLGQHTWAVINTTKNIAWPIIEPFAMWAPDAAKGVIEKSCLSEKPLNLCDVKLLPPVDPTARIFAAGRNYGEHLIKLGADLPSSPTIFMMPHSTIIGPGDDIIYPATTEELDYEIELIAVLAAPLLPNRPAGESILGFTIGNDISARDAAKKNDHTSDLFSHKTCDSSTPIGPWIVTTDELGNGEQPNLDFYLSVNGEIRQSDNSSSMLFPVNSCIDYIDDRVSVGPGDLVFTGSTHGVGLETGRFLVPGDRIDATIDKIGTLSNRVVASNKKLRFVPRSI